MEGLDEWPHAMKEYNDRITKLFGMPIQGASQSGNTLQVRFSKGNFSFHESKYFLNPDKQLFSHLTSYKGLFGIINSGLIRLYNLENSNDPNELFTLNGLSRYENVANNIKSHVFTFSFTKATTILTPQMWIEYGQVAINFEIVNDPMAWDNYRISEMHYGESDFVPKYLFLLREMHEKYPTWNFEPDLESMLSLLAFHKENAHSHEQEVRLLYVPFLFNDRDEAHYDFRAHKIHTGITKYVEMPLFVTDEEKPWVINQKRHEIRKDNSLPLIKIVSIEFGDNEPLFDQKTLDRIRFELQDYLVAKFGYRIPVKEKLFQTGIKTPKN